jgi:hypothetical protein
LLAKGFSFAEEQTRLRRDTLPGGLDELKQYQYFSFIYEYDEQFEANIKVLTTRFLVIPKETRIVPTPKVERETVREMLKVADVAKVDPSGTDWILPLQSRFLFMPLPTPKLAAPANGKLAWTAVPGASGYLLQGSWDEAFSKPEDLYSGEDREFAQPSGLSRLSALGLAGWQSSAGATLGITPSISRLLTAPLFATRYYRVKAKAGLGRLDSAWSNVVKVEPPPLPLPAPKLEEPSLLATYLQASAFRWSEVAGAIGYTLQVSSDETFSESLDVYSGEETKFTQHAGLGLLSLAALGATPSMAPVLLKGGTRYYRVKARAAPGRSDSPWSNIVKVDPLQSLPAPKLQEPSRQIFGRKFTWAAVNGAAGYLLQRSRDEAFSQPEDLYVGPETAFVESGTELAWPSVKRLDEPIPVLARLHDLRNARYYRVKAKAGPGWLDSPWSNVISAD